MPLTSGMKRPTAGNVILIWRGLGRGSRVTPAKPVAQRELYIDSSFFNAERDRPGVLHASIFATVFGNPQEKAVQLQEAPVNVLRGVQCYKGNFGIVRCRSAIRHGNCWK